MNVYFGSFIYGCVVRPFDVKIMVNHRMMLKINLGWKTYKKILNIACIIIARTDTTITYINFSFYICRTIMHKDMNNHILIRVRILMTDKQPYKEHVG